MKKEWSVQKEWKKFVPRFLKKFSTKITITNNFSFSLFSNVELRTHSISFNGFNRNGLLFQRTLDLADRNYFE